MEDVGLPPTRRQRFERRLKNGVPIQPGLQLLRSSVLRRFLERDLLPRLLECDGFVDVVRQGRPQSRDLFDRGEFDPPPRLRMFSDPFEDALRVLEQRAFEERARTTP